MLRVSAAIINNSDNEILICQRGPGGSCEFLWDLFEQMTYPYPEREIEFLFFRASMTDGVPLASVHNCIKWVSPDMLGKYEFCPADVFVVEKLSKGK